MELSFAGPGFGTDDLGMLRGAGMSEGSVVSRELDNAKRRAEFQCQIKVEIQRAAALEGTEAVSLVKGPGA